MTLDFLLRRIDANHASPGDSAPLGPDAASAGGLPPTPGEVLAPTACADMADVRAGIDALDRLLVRLIAVRQAYMDAAARIKPSRAAVRDEARIVDVLEKVRAACDAEGLDWAIAEPLWRAMMEACIAYEFKAWDALRADEAAEGSPQG